MSFRCDDGQDWEVVLWPSPACGPAYADIQRISDGKLSVRPVSYLQAAGIPYTELLDPGADMGYPEPEAEAEAPPGGVRCGRFALVFNEDTFITSWDDWAEAEASAWPLEEGYHFEDTVAGTRLDRGASEWVTVVA